ncbi:MAG: hypothetical protein J6D12_05720 [Peptostreptococcaceae bacterium]|nr:hypothetical protein [Peptostreptococcaceae bacterium]
MHKLLELFTSKRDIKETTKEIKRSNGDVVTTKTTVTSTVYNIPEDIKGILIEDIHNIIRDIKEI